MKIFACAPSSMFSTEPEEIFVEIMGLNFTKLLQAHT